MCRWAGNTGVWSWKLEVQRMAWICWKRSWVVNRARMHFFGVKDSSKQIQNKTLIDIGLWTTANQLFWIYRSNDTCILSLNYSDIQNVICTFQVFLPGVSHQLQIWIKVGICVYANWVLYEKNGAKNQSLQWLCSLYYFFIYFVFLRKTIMH